MTVIEPFASCGILKARVICPNDPICPLVMRVWICLLTNKHLNNMYIHWIMGSSCSKSSGLRISSSTTSLLEQSARSLKWKITLHWNLRSHWNDFVAFISAVQHGAFICWGCDVYIKDWMQHTYINLRRKLLRLCFCSFSSQDNWSKSY